MSIIKVDAGLFRIVHTTVSTEETRYYLNGVCIEPYPDGGALLIATDGHRLLAAHDPQAVCSEVAIINIPKHALAQCKRPKLVDRRELVIDVQNALATINDVKPADAGAAEPIAEMVAAYQANVIDGTFPDWRSVVPPAFEDKLKAGASAFNGAYLKVFGALTADLNKHFDRSSASLHLALTDGHSPVVVRWSGIDTVFGVIMPMRDDVRGFLPAFMTAQPEAVVADKAA